MSARDAIDAVKTVIPFAAALVELGQQLETFSDLDVQIDAAKKTLEKTKQENAAAKAESEAALQAVTDTKIATEKHVADRNAEIDAKHKESMAAIEAANAKVASNAKIVMDEAKMQAAGIVAAAKQQAQTIIDQAHNEAEATKNEYADLTAKTEAARIDHAQAQQALDAINSTLDSIRRH